MNPVAPSFSSAKALKLPSYSEIRPHLIQPAKDAIKVINAVCPKLSRDGFSLGCKH